MSIEQQSLLQLSTDQTDEFDRLTSKLEHQRVDIHFAIDKAWETENFAQARSLLLTAQQTLGEVCALLDAAEESKS